MRQPCRMTAIVRMYQVVPPNLSVLHGGVAVSSSCGMWTTTLVAPVADYDCCFEGRRATPSLLLKTPKRDALLGSSKFACLSKELHFSASCNCEPSTAAASFVSSSLSVNALTYTNEVRLARELE